MKISPLHGPAVTMLFSLLRPAVFSLLLQFGNAAGQTASHFPEVPLPSFPNRTVNIVEYGAVGDGKTMNTEAIARAIAACAQAGGGRVVIPAGLWLTGPIQLASNIELHVEKGALVSFSRNRDDYPLVDTWFEGRPEYRCMAAIYGRDLENIALTGAGVFDGAGEVWRPVKKFKMTERQWQDLLASGGVLDDKGTTWWPSEAARDGEAFLTAIRQSGRQPQRADYEKVRDFLRPVLVQLYRCSRILIDGPTFQNSGAWNLHPLMSTDITLRNVTVRNPWYSQNGDGLDLESCRNVVVYNCTFDVGDDAICLKSGRDEAGRRRGMPTENVLIYDCRVYAGHGGFVIGSEMSGGVRTVEIRDCVFMGTATGLRFKSTRGRGGIVENIHIKRLLMKDIPAAAITFNMFYSGQAPIPDPGWDAGFAVEAAMPVTEATPLFRNISISEVTVRGAGQAVELHGLPEMPLRHLTLRDISISAQQGLSAVNADHVNLINVAILPQRGPALAFHNSTNVLVENPRFAAETATVLSLSGGKTAGIQFHTPNLAEVKKRVKMAPEVNPRAVQWGN
ncbi:MAG: glycoside hydrolase family 28 protein [candidate division KSB1 bacterium]|nr:glycoside hydrolase family 28 protein [candidate division KSB1 bacterium]MDZ7273535.1 glycoside hydrolase family 28 protein [candidate division KSB1 bacterium]MDZ7286874.1 glycoside hydrolase family 28 protein [candidate division KSB1 bacterium]MDZ7299773.1 glycoside hydrolase family 28 protein [candidate division KSB1 bacterium]MDZ7307656.1 glycoside hydrolase family 28 protein [candidate division KSB1 bacterium]